MPDRPISGGTSVNMGAFDFAVEAREGTLAGVLGKRSMDYRARRYP